MVSDFANGLETKPVFDWEHEPLGTILGSEQDPKTHDPTSLIIGLSSNARERLETDQETVSLPYEYVFGIRRDEVRLNRGVDELASAVAPNPKPPSNEDRTVLELNA